MMSRALRTKDRATQSTSFDRAKSRSDKSFSVRQGYGYLGAGQVYAFVAGEYASVYYFGRYFAFAVGGRSLEGELAIVEQDAVAYVYIAWKIQGRSYKTCLSLLAFFSSVVNVIVSRCCKPA
jgi:hypothetical protein